MTRSLVTGGAGFIGSHLVDALLAEGHEVRILDNFATGDRANLLHISRDVDIVEGDLRSFERAAAAVAGCELVFHQAALPSVPRSVQDPLTTNDVNIVGTLNILLAARDAGARRVVYASSSSAYGSIPVAIKREDMPVAPLSPYGVSKQAAESYCSSFNEIYDLETVSLRYFNIFGPRQSPLSAYAAVVPNFIAAALLDEQATVFGDGLQIRDFTYVANAVQANLAAAFTHEAAGHVFNVGCGERTTVLDLVEAVGSVAGKELAANHAPPRTGDIRVSIADIEKARQLLGYNPAYDVRRGLEATFDHFVADDTLLPKIREGRRWAVAGR